MELAPQSCFEVSDKLVAPMELGYTSGCFPPVTTGSYLQHAVVTERNQTNPSVRFVQPGAWCNLAHAPTDSELNPTTGVIFALIGWPASFRQMAGRIGILFSEPRPTLPPVRSPQR